MESVRTRLTQPRYVPDPGDTPAAGVGADLSGGSASSTLALLAAGLPGMPGTPLGHGTEAGQRLLAVTFNDLATGAEQARDAELDRARRIAADPRLRHVVVPGGAESLPFADLLDGGPLTDEPGPSLVSAERHRRRLAAGGADHLIGIGARQVLDAHPARLADLLIDRNRRHLLGPATALAKAEGASARSAFVPLTVYRAARRLARTPYQQGVEDAAAPPAARAASTTSARATSKPGSPRSPGAGRDRPPAGSPARRWRRCRSVFRTRPAAPAVSAVPVNAGPGRPWPAHAADARVFEQAVEVRGQRLHAPFLDNQVVRACQALPETLRVRPGARASVLRAVLAGSGIRDLPPGWGATTQAASAVAFRAGLRSSVDDVLRPVRAPRFSPTRG